MKVLIIEDEILAQQNLKNILKNNYTDIEIVKCLDSVKKAIEWFSNEKNHADIVFMDVKLSDGMCFDIFNAVEVKAKIIITTAFDSYAIKAFKVNSTDYLLKPIDNDELIKAVEKCKQEFRAKAVNQFSSPENKYQKRFTVKFGSRIIIIKIEDVAYFYSEEKSTNVMVKSGKSYILDDSLDSIEEKLNPDEYYRLSRSVIASISAIDRINRQSTNRIKITLLPPADFDVFISRFRVAGFLKWTNV